MNSNTDPLFAAGREAGKMAQETGSKVLAYVSIASVGLGALSTVAAVGLSMYRDIRRDQHSNEKDRDKILAWMERIDRKLSKQSPAR